MTETEKKVDEAKERVEKELDEICGKSNEELNRANKFY